jgi:mycoredoxin
MANIILYGADWCPDCHRSRNYLDQLKLSYDYIDIDHTPGASEEVAKLNNGQKSIPTIIFEDQSKLVEPSNLELKTKLKTLGLI